MANLMIDLEEELKAVFGARRKWMYLCMRMNELKSMKSDGNRTAGDRLNNRDQAFT